MKSESRIQQEMFVWFWNSHCLPSHNPREIIYHIPNEGKDNGKLVPVGLYPGASDLVLTINRRHYYFEVKEPGKGKQSKNQIKFQKHVEQSGFEYFIVYSLEEFKKQVKYLYEK